MRSKKEIFAENVLHYIAARGMTQTMLADKLNITGPSVNMWCTGNTLPRASRIAEIASALGVTEGDLLQDHSGKYDPKKNIRVPILGKIAAGIPIEAIENVLGYEEIEADESHEYFGLVVNGRSMHPTFQDGDTVILKKQCCCDAKQVCAVMVGTEDATLKKVSVQGKLTALIPINPDYDTIVVPTADVKILGVVIELRRKL